jgi:hypothetical protein
LLVDTLMGLCGVEKVCVLTWDIDEMTLVENNDLVEAFLVYRAHPSLSISIGSWGMKGRTYHFNSR